jgi:phosphate/sulfate permease
MKTLIGGAIAAALGLVGLVIWWGQFLMVLAGIVPVILLLGGALAIYLGFDELKDTWKSDEAAESSAENDEGEGVEKYKKEIDDLKEEIETLKKE